MLLTKTNTFYSTKCDIYIHLEMYIAVYALPSSLLRQIKMNEDDVQEIIQLPPSIQHNTTTIMHQVLSKHSLGGGGSTMKHVLVHTYNTQYPKSLHVCRKM